MITKTAITLQEMRKVTDMIKPLFIRMPKRKAVTPQVYGVPGGGRSRSGSIIHSEPEIKDQINNLKKQVEYSKGLPPTDTEKGYFLKKGLPEGLSPKGNEVSRRLSLLHEADELHYGKPLEKMKHWDILKNPKLKEQARFRYATRHVHPNVLLNDHNRLATLRGIPDKDVKILKNDSIALRMTQPALGWEEGLAGSQFGLLNKYLKPFGGYANGTRINRRMKKHISDKILSEYS